MKIEIVITELCGFQCTGYMTGRGNTKHSHNPFTWHWDEGKVSISIDGYRKPDVTKQQLKKPLLTQLKKEGFLK